MSEAEFRAWMAPDQWLSMQQSLILTAAIVVIGLIYLIPQYRIYQASLRELAELYKYYGELYERSPPKVRFWMEMQERERNPEYRRFLKKSAKGREWDARFHEFLQSPTGQEWMQWYEDWKQRHNK